MELLLVFVLAFFVYRLRCQVRDLRARVDRLSGEAPESQGPMAPDVDLKKRGPQTGKAGSGDTEPLISNLPTQASRTRDFFLSLGIPDLVRGLANTFIRN